MAKARGLGKGLDALFDDNITEETGKGEVSTIRLSSIEPNLSQPRKEFDEEALSELAESIKEHGILQPLLVRPMQNGMYQIVAGERRWRAARLAELVEVPALVKDLSDEEADKISLIENLQREDLNAVETAKGYQRLMEKYDMTQEELSKAMGKSRPAIANMLRITTLPDEILKYVSEGKLSAGHAKAILSAPEASRSQLAKKIVDEGLSVREAEKLASKKPIDNKKTGKKKTSYPKNPYFREVQLALTNELGREVKISEDGEGGKLEIPFYNKEELAALSKALEKIKK